MRLANAALLTIWLLTAITAAHMVSAADYDIRDYFPLGEGDQWVQEHRQAGRIVTANLVTKIEGKKKIDGDEYAIRTQTSGAVAYFRHSKRGVENIGGTSKSPIGLVPWSVGSPIIYPAACRIGKASTQNLKGSSGPKLPLMPFKKKLNMNTTFTVLAEETVRVPAGTFRDCLKCKVVIDCGKVLGHTSKTVETFWLAEGIGEVKSEITFGDGQTHNYVLKSATIKGKKFGVD